MDGPIFRAGRRAHTAEPLRLDYPRLIAILVAIQAASRSAQVESALAGREAGAASAVDPLVNLLDPGAGWIAAARGAGRKLQSGRGGRSAVNQDEAPVYLGGLAFLQRRAATLARVKSRSPANGHLEGRE